MPVARAAAALLTSRHVHSFGPLAVMLSGNDKGRAMPRVAARAAAFLVFWVVIHGADPADFPAGVVTALLATRVSVLLLPVGGWRPRLGAVAGVVLRFLWQSLLAGADVAGRALQPRPALQPGLVACAVPLPAGPARSAFCAFESLMPGTMPAGFDADGRLLLHCLDVSRPVAAHLEEDRRRLAHAFGGQADD